ncbi:DgyrCDS7511 [Dimorphilus gyrociliatus]|uniref:DgyrCDS7511 n=1 Tax=Dimorphilus gyrociliatus TaxID=2664684 RepID=A0A7I8VSY1_9ANNE|nr:DgyrCDS7511 [Dimorphilus gyrociliatus]
MSTDDQNGVYGDEKGKLFIGGLSWETSTENLESYFSNYGKLIDCVVMKSSSTGRSRGFGFVKYEKITDAERVVNEGPHRIDERDVDVKLCNPRHLNKGSKAEIQKNRKIFVGGLPVSCTESKLRAIFEQFGRVEEACIMYDQLKSKSRGFGFIVFAQEAAVDRVCSLHYITLDGKQVECKRAQPREEIEKETKKESFEGQFEEDVFKAAAAVATAVATGKISNTQDYIESFSQQIESTACHQPVYQAVFPIPTPRQYLPVLPPLRPEIDRNIVQAQLSALQQLASSDSKTGEDRKILEKTLMPVSRKSDCKNYNIQTAAQAAIQMAAQTSPKVANPTPFIPLNSYGSEINQVKGSYGAIRPYTRHIVFAPYPYVRAAFLPSPGNFPRT